MNFRADQAELSGALNTVIRAISTRPTSPVLAGVYFRVQGTTLTLQATNLELTLITTLQVQLPLLETGGSAGVVLPGRPVADLVQKLPKGELNVEIDTARHSGTVQANKTRATIQGWPPDEFPNFSDAGGDRIVLSQKALRKALRQTTFATDRSGATHDAGHLFLAGIHLHLTDGALETEATDLARIAFVKAAVEHQRGALDLVLPTAALSELGKLLSVSDSDTVEVTVTSDANRVTFHLGRTQVVTRVLSVPYPKLRKIVRGDFPTAVRVPRSDLAEACERAMVVSPDGAVRLVLAGGALTLTARGAEIGTAREEVPVTESRGPEIEVSFNGRYLLDGLKAVDSTDVRLELQGPKLPARISPVYPDGFEYVLLPLAA